MNTKYIKFKRGVLAVTATVILLVFFCGSILDNVDSSQYVKYGAKKKFDCVGMVADSTLAAAGSCVLIGPSTVLTAAHLLVIRKDRPIGSPVYCYFKGKYYQVKEVYVNPFYRTTEEKMLGDLAMLKLVKPVTGVKPAEIYRGDSELGRISMISGYGPIRNASDFEKNLVNGVCRAAGKNAIDSIGGPKSKENGRRSLLFVDMDHPENRTSCNPIGSGKPLPLEYIPIAGDSGGGCFILENGKVRLAAIATAVTHFVKGMASYGSMGCFTRVSVYQSWIDEVGN